MRILVTGADGIIGPYVLERLIDCGNRIAVIASPETASQVKYPDYLQVIVGRLSDHAVLAQAMEKVDVVYHLDGLMAVPGSLPANPSGLDVRGLESLLYACGKTGCRVVFTSTGTIYRPVFWPAMWPFTEDSPQMAYGNEYLRRYSQSRIDSENLITELHCELGFEYVILRPTLIYAPWVWFVEHLLQDIMRNPWEALMRWNWLGAMQWVHARDMAEALVLAGTKAQVANEVFNVAGGENVTIHRLIEIVRKLTDTDSQFGVRQVHFGARNFSNARPRFDISKARRLLGYTPQVELYEGIKEILAVMDHRGELSSETSLSFSQGSHSAWSC
jgi:nucleoside-diphosphate-sugar epimerase